jgi:hypothetical protein
VSALAVHPQQTIVAAGQGGRGHTAAGICIYDTTANSTTHDSSSNASGADVSNELAPVCELILSITGHKVGDSPRISSTFLREKLFGHFSYALFFVRH